MIYDLSRFREAHARDMERAFREICRGKKTSHWMWYIFPQVKGLGMSPTSQRYAISDIEEARQFLQDDLLGSNLRRIAAALLNQPVPDATAIFGKPDDAKLFSSMTLFALADDRGSVFSQVLERYFGGTKDQRTLQLLGMADR